VNQNINSIDLDDQSLPPQTDNPDQPKKAIRLARTLKSHSQSIMKLAVNRWFVQAQETLANLAEDLQNYPGIQAVGVIQDDKVIGVVQRKDIFNVLGRPFGKDMINRDTVVKITNNTRSFHSDANIHMVSDELLKEIQHEDNLFFPITSASNEFVGLFSSRDLLLHLSDQARKDGIFANAILQRISKELHHVEQESFELVCSTTLSRGLANDFCWAHQFSDERWFITVCDISGKGMGTSLVHNALWGIFSSFDFRKGIGALVKHLNTFMIQTFDQEKYVSGFFLEYHAPSGTINVADMGHSLAFILRKERFMKLKISEATVPLGVRKDTSNTVFRYQLEKNDILAILSDGLVKQTNQSGDEYGLARIKRLLENSKDLKLTEVRIKILEDFHAFRDGSPIQDDLSLILLKKK